MGIRVANVTKRFGAFHAVDDVSVDVDSGSLVALLGPSGSGKSTLLRLIAGLEQADTGRIWITGEEATDRTVQDRQVGFVFQHFALFKHRTVRQNVAFGLELRKWKKEAIKRRVDELLDLVQLRGYGSRFPSQLSGGQRQRVALARALLREPRIVLLDEPMSNLDAQLREELRPELRRLLCGREQPVMYVTHDQQEAVGMADRIALLEAGRLQQVGNPRELYTNPANRFVASFLGRPAINLLALEPGRQLGLRPEHLHLSEDGAVAARLLRREWWGHQQLLWLDSQWGTLRVLTAPETPTPRELRLSWQRQHELWFDPQSGARLAP